VEGFRADFNGAASALRPSVFARRGAETFPVLADVGEIFEGLALRPADVERAAPLPAGDFGAFLAFTAGRAEEAALEGDRLPDSFARPAAAV